jgi:hypothetical protein
VLGGRISSTRANVFANAGYTTDWDGEHCSAVADEVGARWN